jgi:hypothetical protein
MAKPTKAQPGTDSGPPDPRDFDAFRNWLTKQPREWSVTIAARAALHVLPMARPGESPDAVMLPMFRATAVVRFAAKYPNRAMAASAAARAAIASSSASPAARAAVASSAAAVASVAAADAAFSSSAAAAASSAASAAYSALAAAADATAAAAAAIKNDAQRLDDKTLTVEQLARGPLWSGLPPPRIGGAWQGLAQQLSAQASHWQVWIDWYDDVVAGAPDAATSEAEDAAFTDIPGRLPWDDGAEAVNTEIARRLQQIQQATRDAVSPIQSGGIRSNFITAILADLAEVASPQPTLTPEGQLNAGPNQSFDVPTVDDDLSTLPIRQRNLIRGILLDLPANAPRHLKDFLRSYDNELKARGAQPILGLLKDDADIIAAAAGAPRAEDEWLEPGMRKAFDLFAENHVLFVEHFPLDAEREAVYARTPLDEGEAMGRKLVEPFEDVAKATQEAHKAKVATDDFLMAIDKMTELARVLSTQPPPPHSDQQRRAPDEIKILPGDRIQPVSVKKRTLLGALGFFERTYNLIGSSVTIATASYIGLMEALKPAIEMLARLLR